MLTATGGTVRGLQATGSGLLAGGDFASIGGRRQANLAAFRADTGLPTDWRVTTDGRVNGIEPAGRRLYIYGPFSRVDGVPRRGFAALDRRTGRVLPRFRPPRPGGFVSGFAVRGSRIYIAGEFNRLGRVRRANSLFALDARTGRVIRRFRVRTRSLSGRESGPGHIQGLTVRGRRLYIGGGFDRVAGRLRPSLAAVDLRTGRLVRGFRPRLRAERREQPYVETIHARGGRLYLLGDFRLVSGRPRSGFAAVQLRTGRVDRSFRPPATAFGRGANLAFGRSRVYLAEESFVNELDGRTGKVLRYGDSRGDEFESVDGMLVLGGRLYAVGSFAPSVADFGFTTDPAGIAIFDLRR